MVTRWTWPCNLNLAGEKELHLDVLIGPVLHPGLPRLQVLQGTLHTLQGPQLNMAVFFWYLVKINLISVRFCKRVHWISHFLQGTRITRSCLTGHPVAEQIDRYTLNMASPKQGKKLKKRKKKEIIWRVSYISGNFLAKGWCWIKKFRKKKRDFQLKITNWPKNHDFERVWKTQYFAIEILHFTTQPEKPWGWVGPHFRFLCRNESTNYGCLQTGIENRLRNCKMPQKFKRKSAKVLSLPRGSSWSWRSRGWSPSPAPGSTLSPREDIL